MAEPPTKRQRHDLSDTITMSAGKGKKSKNFIVHESFATKSSKYIQSALKNYWKEGQEKQISLADHNAGALEGYINWLYTKQITLKNAEYKCKLHDASCSQEAQNSDCSHIHFLKPVKMYTLGDYLGDLRFCNAITDVMELMDGCTPSPSAVEWTWSHTMPDCPVRELVLDGWACALRYDVAKAIGNLRNHSPGVSKDFLLDLLALTETQFSSALGISAAKGPLAQKSQRCKFHKHIDDSDKCD